MSEKAVRGRPSMYRPEFCERVIELGREGKSKAQMAAEFDVSRQTLDAWVKEHPEFLVAITRARDLALAWWEEKAQSHIVEVQFGPKLNNHLWSRSVAARFPDDYRESSKVELTGSLAVHEMSEDEIRAELSALTNAGVVPVGANGDRAEG